MKKQFHLDFSQCGCVFEVYATIRDELELPEWFGANLDALWDALTGIMYVPAKITVSKHVANEDLSDLVAKIIAMLHEAEDTYHEIEVFETM